MLLVTSTTDKIQVITGSAGAIAVHASFTDLNGTTVTPGRSNTASIATATTTDVVAAPGASTYRNVQLLNIRNTHASVANLITIQHTDGTNIEILYKVNLVAGAQCIYDGNGWISYDASGNILSASVSTAIGTDKQVQFNDGGFTNGDAGLTFDKTTDELGLTGRLLLTQVSTEPGAPAAGFIRVYAKAVAGKNHLKITGPNDFEQFMENTSWNCSRAEFTAGVAAGAWVGATGTNLGTPTLSIPALGTIGQMMRRSVFPSVVTTANQQVGTRTDANYFRGNATGQGGFFGVFRFTFHTWTTGNRLFVGFCADTTAIVTANPSSKLNNVGFAVDDTDTAIFFQHNDGSGTATKDTIAGQPSLATNNAYMAIIYCKPNDSVVYYMLYNLTSGAMSILIDSSASTDLPVNTTALVCSCHMGNAANVVAGNASIGVNRIVVDTDF
jgi:hypothetical protein